MVTYSFADCNQKRSNSKIVKIENKKSSVKTKLSSLDAVGRNRTGTGD